MVYSYIFAYRVVFASNVNGAISCGIDVFTHHSSKVYS